MTNIVFKVDAGFGVMQNLSRAASMSAIPRVGEFVTTKGMVYIVRSVMHDLDLNGCVITLNIPKSLRKGNEK